MGCLGGGTADKNNPIYTAKLETPSPSPSLEQRGETTATHIHFIGVSRGESSFIHGDGYLLVIDSGADPNATVVRRQVAQHNHQLSDQPRLRSNSYELWLQNVHQENIGGASALVSEYPTNGIGSNGLKGNTSEYTHLIQVTSNSSFRFFNKSAGFVYYRSGGIFRIHAPPTGYLANDSPAQNELIISFSAHNRTVLWLGNPGAQEEQWFQQQLNASFAPDVVVLSAGATPSRALLQDLRPEIIVIEGSEGINRTRDAISHTNVTVYEPSKSGTTTLNLKTMNKSFRPVNQSSEITPTSST